MRSVSTREGLQAITQGAQHTWCSGSRGCSPAIVRPDAGERVSPRTVVAALFLGLAAGGAAAETSGTRVEPLPTLASASAWTVRASDADRLTLSEALSNVVARFAYAAGTNVQMRLKEPIPVPEWADGLTFLSVSSQQPITLRIDALVRDAQGNEFTFYTQSPFSYQRGHFGPTGAHRRSAQVRFTVPGLKHPRTTTDPTLMPPRPGLAPVKPWTLVGFSFVCEEAPKAAKPAAVSIFIQDLAWTRLDPRATQMYYQWRDQAAFAEVDPLPYITLADFWWWPGTYKLTWEIRDRYDAMPFLAGGKTFTLAEKPDLPPLELQLAQRIAFPVCEEGTYWVRARIQRTDQACNYKHYSRVDETEYRLDVIRGKPAVTRQPLSADTPVENCPLRIGAGRASLVWDAKNALKVPVAFERPSDLKGEAQYTLSVRSYSRNALLHEEAVKPQWDAAGRFTAQLDLSDLPAGAYRIGAEIRGGEIPYDRVERVVGKRAPADSADAAPIPASVTPAEAVLSGKRALFHLADADRFGLGRFPLDEHWEKATKPFLQEAATVSRDVEVIVPWPLVEPLPGVYDWSAVDRYLDTAATNGLRVLLWTSVRAEDYPEWMPAVPMANEEGDVFSHFAYLFHGMHPNYFHSKAVSEPCMRFFEAVAQRYRSHPALDGYYLCMEHPGDAPFRDWYEGYSRESVEDFRRFSREQWRSLKAVNARWGTHFGAWKDVTAPQRNDPSDRYLLDWERFKVDAFEAFHRDFVLAVRKHDPVRLAMVYSTFGNDEWYRDHGCMTANGGAHAAFMPFYAEKALRGLQMRTEEITPRFWSGTGPYQLDQSLFFVMSGGGAHAHCKAFIDTTKRFADVQEPKYSLGRYARFIPIWSELRRTAPAPIETFVYDDLNSSLMLGRSTYTGSTGDSWTTLNLLQAQVPFANTPPDFAERGKLLFVTANASIFMEKETREQVMRFAERGGTVVMKAFAGSKDPDRPAEAWVLLRRFGFAPPEGPVEPDRYTLTRPVPGPVFGEKPGDFVLRDLWSVPRREGEQVAAVVAANTNRVAISWRPVGQGRVAVIWAETTVPPFVSAQHGGGRPFYRDFARWAGVAIPADSDSTLLWTNLLRRDDGMVWYGLVHAGHDGNPVSGRTWWPNLPDGTYHVTELIGPRDLGELPAARLRTEGVVVTLQPHEVAIFRMELKR